QFTRGRPYQKDDNAHIEQKNWTHVRKILGYLRYDSPIALEAINDLYQKEPGSDATIDAKLKQAKIEKNVSMHGLRHTYASMLILLKRPITEVSRYLGHADVAVESTRISYNPRNRTQCRISKN